MSMILLNFGQKESDEKNIATTFGHCLIDELCGR